ncbi:MAG: PadR family transcriptional regulator [Thermofilaceae archaeon]|nr:PadR family transcriptional regulator [Thermofilaceae archaeon]MCX8180048.1 PadR family transcriptional regulator [Thermofilaceae archaeon]MDW8003209.1 PadR family transcriptional regulator [Thermofilaceae archaeon]
MSVPSPLARLMRKVGIENLWLYVIAELCRNDVYPYELAKAIERDFGFKPGKVLPYVVLSKLEAEGFVESYVHERRRYYRVTSKGKALLRDGVMYLRNLSDKLTEVSSLDRSANL